jgi:hypothetical protein
MIHTALNIWVTGETKGTIPDYDRIFSLTMKELDRMFRPQIIDYRLALRWIYVSLWYPFAV